MITKEWLLDKGFGLTKLKNTWSNNVIWFEFDENKGVSICSLYFTKGSSIIISEIDRFCKFYEIVTGEKL